MFTCDKFRFVDDEITVWSGSYVSYGGELTDSMVQRCKDAKKQIESGNSELQWFQIKGLSEYDDGLYLSSSKQQWEGEEQFFNCCKGGGSVFFSPNTGTARISGGPRKSIYRDGHLEKSEYDRARSEGIKGVIYNIFRIDSKIYPRDGKRKHTARMRRSSPEGAGGMYFEFELPVTVLDFMGAEWKPDGERKYD